jgi:CubicO group peptidase (beta-lactamase class C family)
MSRYARMLLRKGQGVFETDIVEKEMFRNYTPDASRCRSFGWDMTPGFLIDSFSRNSIFHSGSSGQSMWIDPEKQRFCIVLTNLFGEHDAGIAARLDIANTVSEEIWGL